jgi:hypothetical protein
MNDTNRQHSVPWWHGLDTDEFTVRIHALPHRDLEHLLGDIRGRLAMVVAQIETSQNNPDRDWKNRAIRARGHLVERKRIVAAAVCASNERRRGVKEERKSELIADAREHLAESRIAEALSIVFDLLEGKHHEDYEADNV